MSDACERTIRAALRSRASFHQRSSREDVRSFAETGVTGALSDRDPAFGDHRESDRPGG